MENPSYDPSVKQLADELQCTEKHVYQLLKTDQLQGYKVGNSTRIFRDSVNRMKQNNPYRPLNRRQSAA